MEEAQQAFRVDILSPRNRAKDIKTRLESQHKLDKSRRISPSPCDREKLVIPTTYTWPLAQTALKDLVGEDDAEEVILAQASPPPAQRSGIDHSSRLQRAAREWLEEFRGERDGAPPAFDVDELVRALPGGFSVYAPVLLLPSNAFASPGWQHLLAALPDARRVGFYARLARAVRATHVALNAPIPPLVPDPRSPTEAAARAPNARRSPANLTPLHGDFGPAPPLAAPSAADLAAALWVTVRQHGVWQTWAPRHIMFARGNVGEKARLQDLVRTQLEQGALGVEAAAVDLFAGIGYFSFAYAKAGVDTVLCWEINPWSVEGMRRGAAMNGWAMETVGREEVVDDDAALAGRVSGKKLVAFHASNETAALTIARVRGTVPPVRHVNCGLLPTSRPSWRTAVAALDPLRGGWVHVHENFAEPSIAPLAEGVLAEFKKIVDDMSVAGQISERKVTLEHVQKVKTYAPGVMHCVLDIAILA
jgi:tRNA wybutosine-synthesizing protein 2